MRIHEKLDFTGKIVAVSGASGPRGVGAAVARSFHELGAHVINIDIAPGDGLLPDRYSSYQCDTTDETAVAAMIARIAAEFPRLDVLVNNAGIIAKSLMESFDMAVFRRVMDVNTLAVAQLTKHCLPLLKKSQAGSILTVSSIQAFIGTPVYSAYSASKAALTALTRVWAKELVEFNITVNTICPSFVHTDMFERALAKLMEDTKVSREQAMQSMVALSPQQRPIQPEEVGDLAVFLASGLARGMTGQSVHLDGGVVMD